MRIQHILYSGLGGHGSVFFSLVNADVHQSHNYNALFNGIENLRDEYADRCRSKGISFTFVKKTPGEHLAFYYKLYRAIKQVNPEIIFLHGSMVLPAALLFRITTRKKVKIVIRETQAMHMKTSAEKMALKLGMRFADDIVFLSKEYKEDVRKNLGTLFKEEKTRVIPNGIDLSIFSPVKKIPGEKIILGMQSRLVAIKDHVSLISAMKLLKNVSVDSTYHLYIAGDGEYRKHLEDLTSQLQVEDCVTFTGMLNESELPSFLQSLDIYIHASLGETMSTAIMQAMACGLPIIASDVDGIKNMIIDKQNGSLVPVKNPQLLADTIHGLASEPDRRDKLAHNALTYAQNHFSNTRMFNSYQEIFQGE